MQQLHDGKPYARPRHWIIASPQGEFPSTCARFITSLQTFIRKVIETMDILIERLLPMSIHAVTTRGIELRVALFELASRIKFF